ncbi:MAG: hypothetical protein CMF46_04895 [Legionellales bacterium]|nr:hypothetical protein [Legionellales bacterium]|tara:strand:+ start:1388 stop:1744 length:357 start_codon:yes stop_codon:yes gene_type:complete
MARDICYSIDMNVFLKSIIVTCSLWLVSCSFVTPTVKLIPIEQGVPIESAHFDKITIGSSEEYVIEHLGSPTIKHPFKPQIWVYTEERPSEVSDRKSTPVLIEFDTNGLVEQIKRPIS